MDGMALHIQRDIADCSESLELLGQIPGFKNEVAHRGGGTFMEGKQSMHFDQVQRRLNCEQW